MLGLVLYSVIIRNVFSAGKQVPVVSLFNQKNVKGWWPCYCDYDPSIPRELTVCLTCFTGGVIEYRPNYGLFCFNYTVLLGRTAMHTHRKSV